MNCPSCHSIISEPVTRTRTLVDPLRYEDVDYCSQSCLSYDMFENQNASGRAALSRFRAAICLLTEEDITDVVDLSEWGMDDFSTGGHEPVHVDVAQMREMALAIMAKMFGSVWRGKGGRAANLGSSDRFEPWRSGQRLPDLCGEGRW